MKKSKIVGIIVLIVVIAIIAALACVAVLIYNQAAGTISSGMSSMDSLSMMQSANYIGYSVGGAKDVENFRENIENGYFPISTDITYNGLFYDYMFDTGAGDIERTGDEGLFFPTYSTAISKDPFSNEPEYYMTVGLNSNIKEEDFQRKKLNLVILLDISGSMGSPFNRYYYDNPFVGDEDNRSKMKIANEAVCTLIDELKMDDRLGIVTFESEASVLEKVKTVDEYNISKLKDEILKISQRGGTNFSAGYIKATSEFENYLNNNKNEYENRIIVITDAMPNYGDTGKDSLMGMVKNNASTGIYTTFIGVGVDFNTKLIEEITDVRGANYYSVHNSKEFKERMGEGFEYMVTPLVFDLSLDVKSSDFEVVSIYGSDSANAKNGNIMKVNTLFPSKSEGGEVKGGVILLKLKPKKNGSSNATVSVSYKDRNGKSFNDSQTVSFRETNEEYYDNTGIRKAVVLVRYANSLKDWILYERSEDKKFVILPLSGIIDAYEFTEDYVVILLGEHERASVSLTVSNEYKEIFTKIKEYIQRENEVLKDETFDQEYEALDLLINK